MILVAHRADDVATRLLGELRERGHLAQRIDASALGARPATLDGVLVEPGRSAGEVEDLRAWAGAQVPIRLCEGIEDGWLGELVRTVTPPIALPGCRVDLRRGTVERGGEVLALTDTEGLLLAWMVNRAGSLVTREELLQKVWGYSPKMRTRVVDVTIGRVRAKIEADPANPVCLRTLRGKGYRLDGLEQERPRPLSAPAPAKASDDLVGRAEVWTELGVWRAQGGLLTLLGPPGVGKTRIARDFAASIPGALWCDLLQASSEVEVVAVIAEALGLGAAADGVAVREALQHGELPLVVLDNAEHVLDPVRGLLGTGISGAVLVTSRVRLGMANEQTRVVPPLAPEHAQTLLLRRARALRSDFEVSEETLATLAALTEGLPLAVELAAAQVRLLSAPDLVRVLQTRTVRDRANPTPHQSYDEALAASWALLNPASKRCLATLAHLRGEVPFALADALFEDALDALGTLGDASMIQVAAGPEGTVFRLLDTVRRYVLSRAEWSVEDAVALARGVWAHLGALHRQSRTAEGWPAVRDLNRLRLLGLDVATQALEAGDPEAAAGLFLDLGPALEVYGVDGAALAVVDLLRGVGTEEQQRRIALIAFLLDSRVERAAERERDIQRARALSQTPAHEADWVYADYLGRLGLGPADPTALQARLAHFDRPESQINARLALGLGARMAEDQAAAQRWLEAALTLADRTPIPHSQGAVEGMLSTVYYRQGDALQAARLATRVADTYEAWGVDDRASLFRGVYGMALHAAGELDQARTVIEAQLEGLRGKARPSNRARLSARLGDVLLDLGLPDEAIERARKTRRLATAIADGPSVVQAALVEGAGWLAREQPERALALTAEHVNFEYQGIHHRAVLLTVFALLALGRSVEARALVRRVEVPAAVRQILDGLIAVSMGERPAPPTADSGAEFTRVLAALLGGPPLQPRLPRGRCLLAGERGPYPEAQVIAALFAAGRLPVQRGPAPG